MMQQMLLGYGPSGLKIDDVFAVTTYTGNGTSGRSINNGLDLDGTGGIVWIKSRNLTNDHILHSTDFTNDVLSVSPNNTNPYANHGGVLTGYNSNGWTMGNNVLVNGYNDTYVAWSFLKAEKFFDVVTYSGNSTAGRTISHNLGAQPGAIWVKELTSGDSWSCYHESMGNTKHVRLNSSIAGTTSGTLWNNTSPTSTQFTVGSDAQVNGNNKSYVAFLFAEDTDNLIKCDSYSGNGSFSGPTINIGFQPQFILFKRNDNYGDWAVLDTTRGIYASGTDDNYLVPNAQQAEFGTSVLDLTSTGFQIKTNNGQYNANGGQYSFIALAAP